MAKRQATLLDTWSEPPKKVREESESVSVQIQARENDSVDRGGSQVEDERHSDEAESETEREPDVGSMATPSNCTALCCVTTEKAFQPVDKQALEKLAAKKRNFSHSGTNNFPG